MFGSAEKKARSLDIFAEERIFSGKCRQGPDGAPVIGRLIFGNSLDRFSGTEALLAVIGDSADTDFAEDKRTVGVVHVSEEQSASAELPYPSITVSSLPPECDGRIALLDPSEEKLFVSPDIVTVNKYTKLLARKNDPRRDLPLTLPNGKSIKIITIATSASSISNKGGGYLFDMPMPFVSNEAGSLEELLFEGYRDAAERAMGMSVTVFVNTDIHLSDRLRALMRGAVFGDISLLFRGVLTENELISALDSFCKTFCELEVEGREFNGYIKRGLLINTPYLLRIAPCLSGVDFLIYDTERLAMLLSGERRAIPREILSKLCEDICRVIDRRQELCHSIILCKTTATPELCQRLIERGITDYYATSDMIESLTEIFWRIIKSKE